jgi:DNA-directed RNA polymerase subunit RPC12/RpoP
MESQMQRLLQKSVEITVNVEESRVPDFQTYAQEFGVLQLLVSKPLKFEDLGLAAIENGDFQCLACSKTFKWKKSAVLHFKNFHADRSLESKVQCPRCSDELAKSALNSHMEKKHQMKNFNQLLKRSFIPDQGNLFKAGYCLHMFSSQ